MSAYCRFYATKWLNIGVRVRLTEVSAERRFILQQLWEENFGTQAGVHLIEGVRLIWGPLNTGSTVLVDCRSILDRYISTDMVMS